MATLLSLLDARLAPGHVVVEEDARCWTWDELRARVLALAARLKALGAQRVALHADNSAAWLIVDMACQQAGLPCIPLPLFFSPGQIGHVLRSAGVDTVFTVAPELFSEHATGQMEESGPGLSLLRLTVAQVPALPEGTGKLTFTSGSTGTPKGVCLGNGQQVLQAQALVTALGLQAPRHLCVLPLAVLLENIGGVYAPLLAGGTVVLRPLRTLGFQGSALQDPGQLLRQLQALQPESLILIPQLLQVLVHAAAAGWQAPKFRFIAVGGARVGDTLVTTARRLGLPVYEGYGLSESVSVVSLNTPDADHPGSCGRPLPHVQLERRDGELVVQGNLMLGYLGDPASWYPQEFATGDLGHLDAEGFVQLDGRRKNLLVSSYGRNIAPEWIESELLATLLFRDAVVTGDARPWCSALLYPVTSDIDDARVQQAIDRINTHLPDYARIGSWLRLPCPLASLPGLLTANGRPRRPAIEAAFHEQIDTLYRSAGRTVSNS